MYKKGSRRQEGHEREGKKTVWNRNSSVSCAAILGKGGDGGEHTPETDLTRCHQDFEEGDRFESSDLRLERCCFLALRRVDTH